MQNKFLNKYRIPSIRALWRDYSENGLYFITICTAHRKHYFGKIVKREMVLSEIGKRAQQNWLDIPNHFPFAKLDEFAVMPNHFHGIIIIDRPGGIAVETGHALSLQSSQPHHPSPPQNHPRFRNQGRNTVSAMVGSFKSAVTKWCHENELQFGWQTRFYDHIIHDGPEFIRIRNYIINNPTNWKGDKFYDR